MNVLIHCPFLRAGDAERLGVRRASLEEIFRTCDVVSIHTPVLPETIGMIDGRLVSLMKPDATLINTARGVLLSAISGLNC